MYYITYILKITQYSHLVKIILLLIVSVRNPKMNFVRCHKAFFCSSFLFKPLFKGKTI